MPQNFILNKLGKKVNTKLSETRILLHLIKENHIMYTFSLLLPLVSYAVAEYFTSDMITAPSQSTNYPTELDSL